MSDSGCYKCGLDIITGKPLWVACDFCKGWAHPKCIGLGEVKEKDLRNIICCCEDCKELFIKLKVESSLKVGLNDFKEHMKEAINDLKDEIIHTMKDEVVQTSSSYADALKKKPAERNLVSLKLKDGSANMEQRKNEVAQVLEGMQILDTRFSDKSMTLNFETEESMNNAIAKLNEVESFDAEKKSWKKLFPKITICNVATMENLEEENKDDVIAALIEKNSFLGNIDRIEEKIKVLFIKQAAGDTKHIVIKCDPEVRKALHVNGDKISLQWGRYNVRDRYMVTVCYHCQGFGHIAKNCGVKSAEEVSTCRFCGDNHKSKDCKCKAEDYKCANCLKSKERDNNHAVGDSRCAVYQKEILLIKSKTDHGY